MHTIAISPDLFIHAENYATAHKTSITTLVEHYLRRLLQSERKETYQIKEISELSPLVQHLVGIIPASDEEKRDINGDKARMEYLQEKLGI